jgi:Tfp pilus assembly protein PilN
MRPVNLIPLEQRRGEHAPSRTGVAPYAVVGVLAAALAGVSLLVLTSNQISDREAKLTETKQRSAALEAQAARVEAYTAFRKVRDQRTTTVASLADSRFDWERVLRQLALVLPSDAWLIGVTGTVNPDVSPDDSVGVAQRSEVPGPALELAGCAISQDAVARLVSALHDIDGVTRVGLASSDRPDLSQAASVGGANAPSVSGGEDCRTRDFIVRFEIVLAFDKAPVPDESGAIPAPPVTAAPSTSAGEPAPGAADASGVGETRQQESLARSSAQSQSDKARDAITTFTP